MGSCCSSQDGKATTKSTAENHELSASERSKTKDRQPEPKPKALTGSLAPDPVKYPIYVGKYDYDSRTDDDLSFKKGDLMYIISTDEGDCGLRGQKTQGRRATSLVTTWRNTRASTPKSELTEQKI